jgi:hypothetical protein
MRRSIAFAAALALALVWVAAPVASRPADALDYWCWDDPLLEINGQRVSINIGVRERDLQRIRGTVVLVVVPEGVTVKQIPTKEYFPSWVHVLYEGKGNNGHIPVIVQNTLITSRGNFDYQMNATIDGGKTVLAHEKELKTNEVATMEFKLKTR